LTRLKGWESFREKRGGEILIVLAALSLFFNRSFFAQCMTAKGLVYQLSFLGLSVLTWLRIKTETGRADSFFERKKYFILFVFFMGFDNHWQTQVLLFPFIALWFLLEWKNWNIKNAITLLTLGVISLSVYLYLPLRSLHLLEPKWGDPVTLHRFLWIVERRLSSHTETFIRGVDHWRQWGGEYIDLMRDYWWPGFWILGLLGAGVLASRHRKLMTSLLVFYLVVLYSLMTVARDEVIFLLNVYLIALCGVFALWGFTGMIFLSGSLGQKSKSLYYGVLLLMTLGVGWGGVRTFILENKSRYTLAEDFGINAMQSVSRNAVLLADGDHYVMPIWYEKYIRGLRPDILFEPSVFLYHDWGWRQLALVSESRKGNPILYHSDNLPGRLGELVHQTSHPVFYSLGREDLDPVLQKSGGEWIPYGLVSRWGVTGSNPKQCFDELLDIAESQRLRGVKDWESDPGLDYSSGEIFRYYGRQHYEAGHWLENRALDWLALRQFDMGICLGPSEAFALNDMAVILGKMNYLPMAYRLCVMAMMNDPDYLPIYENLAQCFMKENNYEEASKVYQKIMDLSGPSPELQIKLKYAQVLSRSTGNTFQNPDSIQKYKDLEQRLKREGMPFLCSVAHASALGEK
jgi:tetratricopeptide (TPR) repeat protein